MPERRRWSRVVQRTAPAGVVLVAGIGFVAALLWMTGANQVPERDTHGIAAPPATVAWQDLQSPGQAVGGLTTDIETFDALPIDSGPPAAWTSRGGGAAAVVPLPTSVDRSLRLTSGTTGDASVVCRTLTRPEEGVIHVALDALLGPSMPDGSTVVTLAAGGTTVAEVSARAGTMEIAAGNGAVQVVPHTPTPGLEGVGDWLHVELTITDAADSLCILSPDAPEGWVAVDNVTVMS